MVDRLRARPPRALPPRRLRSGHGRGDAAPHRAVHRRPRAVRRAPGRRGAPRAHRVRQRRTTSRLDCREARGLRPFDEIARNVRYAYRLLRKTPGFTASIVATLALCLGSNLTIFAVVDSILLRPLPFPDADRLMSVYNTYPKAGVPERRLFADQLLRAARPDRGVRRRGGLPRGHGDRGRTRRNRAGAGHARLARLLLHAGPRSGDGARVHRRGDRRTRTSGVAILTDAYWRQRLNGDPNAIGRRIRVDGSERIVVGVLPPEFSFLSSRARIYLPLASNPAERAVSRAALGQLRHDRAAQVGRLRRRGAVADRRAQRRARGGQSRGAGDGRRRLPLDRRAAARRPRRDGPRDSGAVAGRRARAAAHRRGQRHQPVADPRQRPRQGARGASGDRRQPAARRHGSAGGDDPGGRCGRTARPRGRSVGHRACCGLWAPNICRWASASPSMRGWRSSALAGAVALGHRDRRAHRLVSPADPVVERAAVGVPRRHADARSSSVCATASSWPRSRWPSCCWPARGCSRSASNRSWRSPRDSGRTTS